MTSKNMILTLLTTTILASCSDKPGGSDKNDPKAPRIMQIPQMNIYTLKEGMGTSIGDFIGEANKFQQGLSAAYSIDTNILNVSIPSQMTTLKEYIDKGLTKLTDIPDNKFDQTSPFILVLKNKDGKPDTVNINENKLAKLNVQALILDEGTTFSVTGKPVTWSIGKINDIFGYMVEGSTNIYIGNIVSYKGNLTMGNGMLFLDSGFLVETKITTQGATILHFKSPSNAPQGLSRKYITLGHGTIINTSNAIGVNATDPSKKIGLRGITIDDGQTVELNDLGKDKTSVSGSPGATIDVATPNAISTLTEEQNKTHGVTNRGTLKITKGTIIGDVTNNTANPEKSLNKGVMLISGEIKGDAYNTQGNFLISGGTIEGKFENGENGVLTFDGRQGDASIKTSISNLAKSIFFIKTKNTLETPSVSFDSTSVIKVALTDDASDKTVVKTTGTVNLQNIALSLIGDNEAVIEPKDITLIATDAGTIDNLNTALTFDPSLKVGGKTATADDIKIEAKDGKVILQIINKIDAGPKKPADGSAPYIARTNFRDFDPRTVHGNDASIGDFQVSMVETDTNHQASFKFGQFHGYAQYSTTKMKSKNWL